MRKLAILAALIGTLAAPSSSIAYSYHYHRHPIFHKHFLWASCAVILVAAPAGSAPGATGASDVAVTHCWKAGMVWVDPPGYQPPGS